MVFRLRPVGTFAAVFAPRALAPVAVFLLLAVLAASAYAQSTPLTSVDLLSTPGTVIAQGSTPASPTTVSLTGYRVEELSFAPAVAIEAASSTTISMPV